MCVPVCVSLYFYGAVGRLWVFSVCVSLYSKAACLPACLQLIQAHGPGVKAPSLLDGQPVLSGVRAMCMRANNSELVTGGSDGSIICWDITSGNVGRVLKTVQVGGWVGVWRGGRGGGACGGVGDSRFASVCVCLRECMFMYWSFTDGVTAWDQAWFTGI